MKYRGQLAHGEYRRHGKHAGTLVSPEVLRALDDKAQVNNRSRAAEIRHALENHVRDLLQKEDN